MDVLLDNTRDQLDYPTFIFHLESGLQVSAVRCATPLVWHPTCSTLLPASRVVACGVRCTTLPALKPKSAPPLQPAAATSACNLGHSNQCCSASPASLAARDLSIEVRCPPVAAGSRGHKDAGTPAAGEAGSAGARLRGGGPGPPGALPSEDPHHQAQERRRQAGGAPFVASPAVQVSGRLLCLSSRLLLLCCTVTAGQPQQSRDLAAYCLCAQIDAC